jgi:hypothetical protein
LSRKMSACCSGVGSRVVGGKFGVSGVLDVDALVPNPADAVVRDGKGMLIAAKSSF